MARTRIYPWGRMPHADAPQKSRVNVDVSTEVRDKIYTTAAHEGIITFAVQTALQNISDFIDTHDISHGDSAAIIDFIRNGSNIKPSAQAATSNGTRRTKRVNNGAAAKKKDSPNGDKKSSRAKKKVTSKSGN